MNREEIVTSKLPIHSLEPIIDFGLSSICASEDWISGIDGTFGHVEGSFKCLQNSMKRRRKSVNKSVSIEKRFYYLPNPGTNSLQCPISASPASVILTITSIVPILIGSLDKNLLASINVGIWITEISVDVKHLSLVGRNCHGWFCVE